MKVTNRHHLRRDEIKDLVDRIEDATGVDLEGERFERVEFEEATIPVVLVDGEPAIALFEEGPFLTVRGANDHPPTRRRVTVDAGAVSFVSDGADIMRPGIVEADHDIHADDLVVVDEETHRKVLAIGRALVDGSDLLGESGKVVESIHHVGDELYEFTP